MTCPPFRDHTEPLYFANKSLNVCDINDYIIGTLMYECLYGNISGIFINYFQRNADAHDDNLRNANDLHVPYERLDIRKFISKSQWRICGIISPHLLKTHSHFISLKNMRHYLTDKRRI